MELHRQGLNGRIEHPNLQLGKKNPYALLVTIKEQQIHQGLDKPQLGKRKANPLPNEANAQIFLPKERS